MIGSQTQVLPPTSGNAKTFTYLINYQGADNVMIGNGQVLPITAIGSVCLNTDVLHVPSAFH